MVKKIWQNLMKEEEFSDVGSAILLESVTESGTSSLQYSGVGSDPDTGLCSQRSTGYTSK